MNIHTRPHAPTLAGALLLGLGLSACGKDATQKKEETVTPPAVRQLTTRPLFDTMPIENSVVDPTFSMSAQGLWMAYNQQSQSAVPLLRFVSPNGPAKLPALFAKKSEMPPGAVLLGFVGRTSGAIEASIWAGRKANADDTNLTGLSVSLTGLFTDGVTYALDLRPESKSTMTSADGIVWHRLAVTAPEGPLGFTYLVITDTSDSDYYLMMPVAAPTPVPLALERWTAPVRRALTETERWAVARAEAERSHRLSMSATTR